jgi:transcription elongation factor GreA
MQLPKRRNDWKQNLGPADEYLTPDAIDDLKKELKNIEASRPAAVSELQRTREMGDLSENFAYSVAKARVMGMDGRIFKIKERLKNAKQIKVGGNDNATVGIGSVVVVLVNGKEKELTILGTQQADPLSGKISYHSPVGAAIIGKRPGEKAVVEVNGKKIDYKIITIK